MVKRKWFSVEEVVAAQASNPEFVERQIEREKLIEQELKRYLDEEAPIRRDLSKIGVFVENLWDFVNGSLPNNEAAAVIKTHFSKEYGDKVIDALVRCLMDKKFSGYITRELLKTLNNKPYLDHGYRPYLRHAIADALRITGADLSRSDVETLLGDTKNNDISDTLKKILKKLK